MGGAEVILQAVLAGGIPLTRAPDTPTIAYR